MNTPFDSKNLAWLAGFMTIEDIERQANMFGEQFGEDTREAYMSAMFDGLHNKR